MPLVTEKQRETERGTQSNSHAVQRLVHTLHDVQKTNASAYCSKKKKA